MKSATFRVRTAWAALVAAILGLCAFLYVKTQAVDLRVHAEFVDTMRRVQQLDAVLKQQVLASRFGLLNQYDALTRTSGELSTRLRKLREQLALVRYGGRETGLALDGVEQAHARVVADIEQFKMQSAVLKNSLYYLPQAGDDFVHALPATAAELRDSVHTVVESALVHNLLKSDELGKRIGAQTAALGQQLESLPESVRSQGQTLLAHARAVLRQQELVEPIIVGLTSNALAEAAQSLESAYTRSFEAAVESTNTYRVALYGCVVALLIAVFAVGRALGRLYQRLESLVAERTKQLEATLGELWGEMALAKKIQSALVPTHPSLKNCEVAAVMKPADQVGGDYYDVLCVEGTEWVLIGDVSGHGIPAGLVMMMCQTAVHTVLESDPHIRPDKLLEIVNRALTENIRRLGEDKYMTINALCRDAGGRFYFSGLHQDIFIYRAASGLVEEIPAEGTCLGLQDSIEGKLSVGHFDLEPGDVLFLYTDGITEAVRDGRMLDTSGLKTLLKGLGSQSAPQIVDGILSQLSGYAVADDMTAIAIKQRSAA